MPPAPHLTPPPIGRLLFFDAARAPLLFYAAPMADAVRLDTSNPKWIQLCTVGSYVYQDRRVDVTPQVFDDFVRNFRASPAYRPDGVSLLGRPDADKLVLGGGYGVIALNFDHPPKGGPRPGHGWFLDVERRGSDLWGLCWFDAEAHAGMLSGAWKWTSIEWQAQWTDNKGAPIGAYLSGVALTNDPFITGMVPIQMSARADGGRGGCIWFGPATDVVCELKCALGLPETADAGALLGELAKLRAWALGPGPAPLGVDVAGLLEKIRAVLNLPRPPDPASIFSHLDTLLGHLADEQERETPMPIETTPAKPTELSRRIAARLSALGSLFFGAQAPALSAEDEPRLVIEVERFFDRAASFKQSLDGMMQATGESDPQKIADMLKQAVTLTSQIKQLEDQLAALLPEVEAAHVAEERAEGEMAAQDVAAVMSRLSGVGMPEAALTAMRSTLMLQRLGGDVQYFGRFKRTPAGDVVRDAAGKPIVASPAERQTFRRQAAEKFRSEHQIQRADQNAAPQTYSFANLYAGPGAQYAGAEQQGTAGAPWYGFSAPQAGQQGQAPQRPTAPAVPGAWTWSRVAQLPPAAEDNPVNRIVDEMIRTEVPQGARASQAQISAFFARVPGILSQLGEMPPQFFSAFSRAA